MAIHGKSTAVVFGGFDLTRFLRDVSPSRSTDTADVSHFGTEDKKYLPGMSDGTVSVGGMFDGNQDAVSEVLEDAEAQDVSTPLSVIFGSIRPGSPAQMGRVLLASFDTASPVSDVVSVSGTLQIDGGLRSGVCLTPSAPVAGTIIHPAVNNQADSAGGGVAYLHVTDNAYDGATEVIVQHSVDEALWVDLASFEPVPSGANLSEAVAIAGQIDQYTRASVNLSGTTGEVRAIVTLNRVK